MASRHIAQSMSMARELHESSRACRVVRGSALLLLAVLLAGGCRTPARKQAERQPQPAAGSATNAPATVAQTTVWSEITFVNTQQGYVVLRSKGLISAAGEARVWRGTNEVARLRVGGPARFSWLTADIISGHPQPHDRVELKMTKTQNLESGGRP